MGGRGTGRESQAVKWRTAGRKEGRTGGGALPPLPQIIRMSFRIFTAGRQPTATSAPPWVICPYVFRPNFLTMGGRMILRRAIVG